MTESESMRDDLTKAHEAHVHAIERKDHERGDLFADWPDAKTIDGVKVVPGLWVLDYNWRVGKVTDRKPDMNNGVNDTQVAWFHLTTGYFDGSRMWAYHPQTGKRITGADQEI